MDVPSQSPGERRRKIGVVVDSTCMASHVGVRNYLQSLYALLERCGRVDWISFERDPHGDMHWFHLIPRPRIAAEGEEPAAAIVGNPREIAGRVRTIRRRTRRPAEAALWTIDIGSNLAVERYDLIVIGAPWLVTFDARLPADKVVGMVYDIIPNRYVLSRTVKPLAFASQHRRGFEHYRRHCDCILAISEPVASDYRQAFHGVGDRTMAMPPLLPASYGDLAPVDGRRDRRIALAAPFDPRKGLACMPAILNAVGESLNAVSIYGKARCSSHDQRVFFESLAVEDVEWFPVASAGTVHKIFQRSKVLLFPSFDEGLGLPILEAQYCGCRVMARDRPPMNTLIGPGGAFLPDDPREAGARLAEMLTEDFDHVRLQAWARERFQPNFALARILKKLEWPTTAAGT